MKPIYILACFTLLLTLCSCRSDSSSSSLPQSTSSSAAASAASVSTAESSSPASSSSSASSASSSSESTGRTVQDCEIAVTTSAGNPVTLVLTVPSSWESDGYSVFTDSETGIKCLEIAAVYEITDPQHPITDDMLAPFKTGYDGVQPSSEFIHGTSSAKGRPVEYYRTASTPDGSEFTWYTFFTFSYDESYVYQLHFFTTDENAAVTSFSDVIASAHIV